MTVNSVLRPKPVWAATPLVADSISHVPEKFGIPTGALSGAGFWADVVAGGGLVLEIGRV